MTSASARRAAVRAAAAHIVTLLNEVEAGVRPARQVSGLFAAHLRGAIRRARPQPGPVAALHRLVISSTVEGTFEIVAICRRGRRFGAVGLRLARNGGGWVVTDVAHPRFPVNGRPALSDPPGSQRSPTQEHR